MKARLVVTAIEMAVARRDGDVAGCIFHTDRGSQPTHPIEYEMINTHRPPRPCLSPPRAAVPPPAGSVRPSRRALRWAGGVGRGRAVGVGELGEVDGEEQRFSAHEDAVGGFADGVDPELAVGAVS